MNSNNQYNLNKDNNPQNNNPEKLNNSQNKSQTDNKEQEVLDRFNTKVIKYGIVFFGIVFFIFVTIVLNGVLVSMRDEILNKAKNNVDIDKFIHLIWNKYLIYIPLIILGYFVIFIGILFVFEFFIFFLLKTEKCNNMVPGQSENSPANVVDMLQYLQKILPILFKVFVTLILFNIFLLVFITIFLITPKYLDEDERINNKFIKKIFQFYNSSFIIGFILILIYYIGTS
tara:strand:+ start:56 stop:742 length:687 start_codon:yes stop_codon:yes gene_type:complete